MNPSYFLALVEGLRLMNQQFVLSEPRHREPRAVRRGNRHGWRIILRSRRPR